MKKNRRGETVLEVLIALFMLILGSSTATALIVISLGANTYNKDALQALNLAQEGIEHVHNLRDTNWIRFSSDRQGCWNMKSNADTCIEGNRLSQGNYALGKDLIKSDEGDNGALDLENETGNDVYKLKYFDIGQPDCSNGGSPNYISSGYDNHQPCAETKFYRSINISYKKFGSDMSSVGDANSSDADIMIVTSNVQWKDGGAIHKIVLSSLLTSYR